MGKINLFLIIALSIISLDCGKNGSNALKVGCITILTGEGATYGKETKQGLDLAFDEINRKNDVLNKKKISLIYEDEKLDPKTGTQAINKLISIDKVPIIIGAFSSRVTLAIAPIAEKNKVVLISASATADAIKDAGDYIFRIVPPNKIQGTTAAKFLFSKLGKTKAAIYYVNDEYGVSLAKEFKISFTKLGGKILFNEAFFPGQIDFKTSLKKIKNTGVEAVYFPGQYTETGLILKQARELNLKTIFLGGDGSYSPDLIKIAGDAANGSYYTLMTMGYGVSDSLINEFTSKFVARYNEKPSVYAAYAFELGNIIGKILSESPYISDSIKQHLYKLHGYKGITGITSFDKYGEVDKDFSVFTVTNNTFELFH